MSGTKGYIDLSSATPAVPVLTLDNPAPAAFDLFGHSVAVDGDLALSIRVEAGELQLRDVFLFDHVQYGGVYGLWGEPGPLLDSVRRMNRDFTAVPAPSRCTPPVSPAAADPAPAA